MSKHPMGDLGELCFLRKPPLVPDQTAMLMALFAAMPAATAPVATEVTMPGPVMTFPVSAGSSSAAPLTSTALEPEIAVISESVLADAIIEMADSETGNQLGAGYNYGVFNINLLTLLL